MASIGGKLVMDVAKDRLKNLKTTGGLPPKKMTPPGVRLGNDAKNIKIRQNYENIPEAQIIRTGKEKAR